MGGYLLVTATSTSVSSTKEKEIISTALIDDTPNISGRYSGWWVYGVADGNPDTLLGVQRQLRQLPLDATTGTLYTTRAFASAPASGSAYEMFPRIPAIRDDASGRDGFREIINEALRLMVVPDVITVAGVTDQTKYELDLTTHPWLREPGRIVNIKIPTPNTNDYERIDPQAYDLIPDGEKLILQLRRLYDTGETFKLEVLRPANSRLKQSSTWTDQSSLTAGLSLDTDEAIPSINDVVAVARELCFAELAGRAPEAEARMWMAKEQDAGLKASALKFVRQAPTEPYSPLRLSGVGDLSAFR